MQSVDLLNEQFELGDDPYWQMTVDSLGACSAVTVTPAANGALVESAVERIDRALAADRFSEAGKIATIADAAAKKTRDQTKNAEVAARRKEIDRLEGAFNEQREAANRLKSQPDDPAANLAVGKYLCLVKGRWETGLPHLAKAADAAWRAVAQKELAAPATADSQNELAEAWYQLAQQADAAYQPEINDRALFWYRKALPNFSGLHKASTEKRIAELTHGRTTDSGGPLAVSFKEETTKVSLGSGDLPEDAVVTLEVLRLEGFPDGTKTEPTTKTSGAQVLKIILRAEGPRAELRLQLATTGGKRILKVSPFYVPRNGNAMPLTADRLADAQKTIPGQIKEAKAEYDSSVSVGRNLQSQLDPLLTKRARLGTYMTGPGLIALNNQISGLQPQLRNEAARQRRLDRSIGQLQHNQELLPTLTTLLGSTAAAKIHLRVFYLANGKENELLRMD